jgi:cell division protease FtsH
MAAVADETNDVERLTSLNRAMPTDVRNALSWLAHLLDASLPLRRTVTSSRIVT